MSRASRRPTSSPAAIRRASPRRSRRARFDAFVVPGWGLRSYLQAVRACRRAKVPVLVRGDSQLASQRGGAIRLAKALIFPRFLSASTASSMSARGTANISSTTASRPIGCSSRRTASTTRPFGAPATRPTHEARARRASARRVLFVGKLIESQAAARPAACGGPRQGPGRQVEVAFAGAGEAEAGLKQAAADAGISATFHGFVNQSELPAVYAAADVIVSPSVETWGLVVNEAMACGVPAVVSDAVGCGPDLIEDGRTGTIFPLDDIPGLARAIEAVLAFDPTRAREAIAARMAVYSPNRTAQGIIDAAVVVGGLRQSIPGR